MSWIFKELEITPFVKQCWVTGAVCANIVGHGCLIGYPAVLMPQLRAANRLRVTPADESWITSVMSISLVIGNFVTPPLMGRAGRRAAHLAVALPAIAGWFFMVLAASFQDILIGRILHGLSFGMLMPLRSVLIGEYTSPKKRGAFLMLVSLAQAFGIFFVHLIGSLMSWQRTALVCVFFSFVGLLMTIYAPESPSWLADKGRYEECRRVFQWLRGAEESDELEEMIQARILIEKEKIKRTSANINLGQRVKILLETFKKREFYIPIILMLHAYFMLQFAGGTTMAAYSTKIIDLVVGKVDVNFWMVFLDCQRLFFNVLAVYIIDKVKRRTMMFGTGGLCVISHLAIALYVYARIEGMLFYDAQWIPLLLINVQFVSVAMGMVPMPSVIAGEVFPLEYRSIGGSISLVSMAVAMFIALKTFPGLTETVGIEGTYLLYGIILTYNLVVIWYLLPETKGRTLQQIEDEFRGRPLQPEELEVRMSLQSDPVQIYKRKMSARRCSSPILH